jgi:cell division protein FtsB
MATTEVDQTRRRASLTGRAAVLALVVCLLAISLAYPLREYLSQRNDISRYQSMVTAQQRRVSDLEATKRRWRDPAYVKAQARERLHFVMPGETSYVVLEPDEAPAPSSSRSVTTRLAERRPWYGDLWHSVQVAGETGAAPAPR